jgi:hypothetical protein
MTHGKHNVNAEVSLPHKRGGHLFYAEDVRLLEPPKGFKPKER